MARRRSRRRLEYSYFSRLLQETVTVLFMVIYDPVMASNYIFKRSLGMLKATASSEMNYLILEYGASMLMTGAWELSNQIIRDTGFKA